jgi:hypothetical protein
LNGQSIEDSVERFEELAKIAFRPRKVLDISLISRLTKIPLLSRLFKEPMLSSLLEITLPRLQTLLVSYFADGLYLAKNIEAVLIEAFGSKRSILDYSYATSVGTRIGLPVATVQPRPSCHIFTNYNGVGAHEQNQVVEPKDGFRNVPVWEM